MIKSLSCFSITQQYWIRNTNMMNPLFADSHTWWSRRYCWLLAGSWAGSPPVCSDPRSAETCAVVTVQAAGYTCGSARVDAGSAPPAPAACSSPTPWFAQPSPPPASRPAASTGAVTTSNVTIRPQPSTWLVDKEVRVVRNKKTE